MKTTQHNEQTAARRASEIYNSKPKSWCLLVKYLGPTNTKGSRVKIINHDLKHRNNDKPLTKTISYNYECNDITQMVLTHLLKNNINLKLMARNHRINEYEVLMFEWSAEELAKLFNVKLED